jgi:hypothetical protein
VLRLSPKSVIKYETLLVTELIRQGRQSMVGYVQQHDQEDSQTSPASDAAFFCSLMCFIPWAKFLSISSIDDALDDDNPFEMTSSDDISMNTTSTLSFTSSSRGSPTEIGWSVFHSRRRNSLDSSAHSLDFNSSRGISPCPRSPSVVMRKRQSMLVRENAIVA